MNDKQLKIISSMGLLITVDCACEQLGLNPSLVRKHIREGVLRAVRKGRGYIIAREELARYIRDKGRDWS